MTLKQARLYYRISWATLLLFVAPLLVTRYGAKMNPYAGLGVSFGIVAVGLWITQWRIRLGERLDAHDAAVAAAAKKHALPLAE